jgi:tetratricopeptide (TPR) repeat protein
LGIVNFRNWLAMGLALALTAGCAAAQPKGPDALSEDVATGVAEATASAVAPTATPTFDELMEAGQDAAASGDWEGALALYDRAIVVDAGRARSFLLRGEARAALGDLNGALVDYDQAITTDATSSEAYNARALARAQAGDGEGALADFEQALQLQPGFALIYRNRAEVQRTLGEYQAAILDLQRYLELLPQTPERAWVEGQIAELEALLTPTAGEGGLLFADDFSDPASGWYANGDPAGIAEYGNGGYVVGHSEAHSAAWALPGKLFGDIRIEVSTKKLDGDHDNYFGVMCRVGLGASPQDFYVMLISSDGFYGIGKRVGGGDLELIGQRKMQYSNAIKQGEQVNQMQMECVGSRLSLSVNGQLLMEVEDSDLSAGQIGLFAGTQEEPGTRIRFSDLAVYVVTGE